MMKHLYIFLFFYCCTFGLCAAPKIKVACVGNSITYGAGIVNPARNSYPVQLQTMLGDGYEVRNFGVSGRTLLSKGDLPYVRSEEYKQALKFMPDVVFIKLGTNDSKSHNRVHIKDFVSDYKALVNSFQALESKPRIILLTPIPAFNGADTVNITDEVIRKQIIPLTEQVAYEMGVDLIHLYPLFTTYEGHVMPDKIHPSSIGAGRIAKRLYEQLLVSEQEMDVAKMLGIKGEESNFYGYSCLSFDYDGAACKVVRPRKVAQGAPWIWRARFWGHEPQTDVALLDRGFHVVYCDVADLFGNSKAVERWNGFYDYMQKGGLNPKVVLEGMSRGGLIVYNWAAANPGKVACIYADAPVLDFKSWPMGMWTKRPSGRDVDELFKAYGFKDAKMAMDYRKNPVDHVKKLVKGGFPMLHVVGDKDDVVPVAENTTPFEQGILAAGGDITVIHKAEVNHHPHSLKDPTAIVDFILRATGRKPKFTMVPTQGNEYRSGAGWAAGKDWWANHVEISEILQQKQVDLLLIGNSITQGLGGSRKIVTYKPGKAVLDRVLGEKNWESAGISGDRTEHVLFRILHGNYGAMKPKKALLTIGVNNVYGGDEACEIADGIIACAKAMVEKLPGTEVIVCATLPAGKEADGVVRTKIIKIGEILERELKGKQIKYVNWYDHFVWPDGSLRQECFGGDHLHLSTKGYEVWAALIGGLF